MAAMATTAKASLISNKSTSPMAQPVCSMSRANGADGRSGKERGGIREGSVTDDHCQRLEARVVPLESGA